MLSVLQGQRTSAKDRCSSVDTEMAKHTVTVKPVLSQSCDSVRGTSLLPKSGLALPRMKKESVIQSIASKRQ